MSSSEAWSIVWFDIWHIAKYILPSFLWTFVGLVISDRNSGGIPFFGILLISILVSYWSYQ